MPDLTHLPRLHIVRPTQLSGVEVWHNCLDAMRTGGVFEDFSIGAMIGPSRWSYRGHHAQRSGSYIMTVQPGECCPVEIMGPFESRIVFITQDQMHRAADERGIRGEPYFSGIDAVDDDAWRCVRAVIEATEKSSSALTQQVALAELLELAFTRYLSTRARDGDPVAHRAVRRMRDLIRERYSENLTLDELAAHARLNKFYALRAFKQAVGVPPNTYQRHVRIAKARELLRAGHDGVQLALDLGFCDQSHFVRWFHRIANMTPRQYLRGR
jgi:AraC-like DNA-binding protein